MIFHKQRERGREYRRKPGVGRKPMGARQVFSAIVYVLRTGIQWKALAREFGSASAVHRHFQNWQAGGDQNSAIYMGHDPKTKQIMVVDQWPPPNAKQYNAPFKHPLENHGEGHNLQNNRMENNAYYYLAIIVP